MDGHEVRAADGPIFDTLNIDLFVKVLAHTAFSNVALTYRQSFELILLGPFFLFFIPVFYIFQGAKLTDSVVMWSGAYYVAVSLFCGLYLANDV